MITLMIIEVFASPKKVKNSLEDENIIPLISLLSYIISLNKKA